MAARLWSGDNPPCRQRTPTVPPLHKGGLGLAEPLPYGCAALKIGRSKGCSLKLPCASSAQSPKGFALKLPCVRGAVTAEP